MPAGGELLAHSELHHSLEPRFAERLPWTLASVKLDCGPVVLVHLADALTTGSRRVVVRREPAVDGGEILCAVAENLEER